MPLSKVARMCLESNPLMKYEMLFMSKKLMSVQPRRGIKYSKKYLATFNLIREDPEAFFQFLNVSLETFDYILEHVRADLCLTSSGKSPEEMLVMTLRYLSTGIPFRKLAMEHKTVSSRAVKIVFSTMDIIWKKLSPTHLRDPTHSEMNNLAQEYYDKWKFPNCVGAIGGKYVRILTNSFGGSQKVILNAVVDANFRFLFVNVIRRLTSRLHIDSLEDSYKYVFKITGMQCLPGTEVMLPLVIIGNEAYPLKSNLMKPYPARASSFCEGKEIFNDRLKQARITVDCAFEILTEKWKIYTKPLSLSLSEAYLIGKTTCLLHNIIKDRDGDRDPHFSRFGQIDNGIIYLNLVKHKSRKNNRASSVAISIRDQLCEYLRNN